MFQILEPVALLNAYTALKGSFTLQQIKLVFENQFAVSPEPYDENTIRNVQNRLHHLQLNETFDPTMLITPKEVQNILQRLRRRNAPVPEKIPATALKQVPRNLLVQLIRLCNAIFINGHYPTTWKNAKVIMVSKTDKDNLFSDNHRPCCLSKKNF